MTSPHHRLESPLDAFGLVWTGWFWGTCAIFVPIFSVGALLGVSVGIAAEEYAGAAGFLLTLAVVPLIAAGQGVVIGGVVVLGLSLHKRTSSWRGSRSNGDQAA